MRMFVVESHWLLEYNGFISLSTVTLKPRHLFRSQAGQLPGGHRFPQVTVQSPQGLCGASGRAEVGRRSPVGQSSRCLWSRRSALSASTAPSSSNVGQEAP